MKRRTFARLLLVTGAVGVVVYFFALPLMNPLRRSPERIAASLLEQTPPGTPRAEVQAVVDQRGWRPGGILGLEPPGGIGVGIGSYQDVFTTQVYAYWAFDQDGRLMAVRVNKFVSDAP